MNSKTELSRDVIADLWLVYTSGEASEDTRAIVENFLDKDPEFALILNQKGSTEMIQPTCSPLSADQELQALNKTRKRLRSQRILMAFAIFFSLTPLSSYGNSSEGLVWMMLRDAPTAAGVYFVIGLGFWAAYFLVRRGLREKGF